MLTVSLILAGALAAQEPAKMPAGDGFVGPLEREDHRRRRTRSRAAASRSRRRTARSRRGVVWRWGSYVPAKSVEVKDGTLVMIARGDEGQARDVRGAPRGRPSEGQGHLLRRQGPPLRGEAGAAPPVEEGPRLGRAGHALRRQDPERVEAPRHEQEERLGGRQRRPGRRRAEGQLRPRHRADLPGHEAARRVQRPRPLQQRRLPAGPVRGPDRDRGPGGQRRLPQCGAVYSRIARTVDATKPAGEWQTYDITFVGRQVTVVLNGQTIVQGVVEGITGGALSPYEDEPGPLMLQGDHGKVRFRNIVVTPAQ